MQLVGRVRLALAIAAAIGAGCTLDERGEQDEEADLHGSRGLYPTPSRRELAPQR